MTEQKDEKPSVVAIYRLRSAKDKESDDWSQGSTYRLESSTGRRLDIGSAKNIENQRAYRSAYLELLGYLPKMRKQIEWDKIAEKIMEEAITIYPGHPAHSKSMGEREETDTWLEEYFEDHGIAIEEEEVKLAKEAKRPYIEETNLFLFGTEFKKWLRTKNDERISVHELSERLRNSGLESVRISQKDRRRVWKHDEPEKWEV